MVSRKNIMVSLATRDLDAESDYQSYCINIDIERSQTNWIENNLMIRENDLFAPFVKDYSSPYYRKNSGIIWINPHPDFNFFVKSPGISSSSRVDFTGRPISDKLTIVAQGLTQKESAICLKWIIDNLFNNPQNLDSFYKNPIFTEGKPNLDFEKIQDLINTLSIINDNVDSENHGYIENGIENLLKRESRFITLDQSSIGEIREGIDDCIKIAKNPLDILENIKTVQKRVKKVGNKLLPEVFAELNSEITLYQIRDSDFVYFLKNNKASITQILSFYDYQSEGILLYWMPDLMEVEKLRQNIIQKKSDINFILSVTDN